MHNTDDNDLESRKEIIQVLLAAAFIIIVITAWVMTR